MSPAIGPVVPVLPIWKVPPVIVVPPVFVASPVTISVPAPVLVNDPKPEILPVAIKKVPALVSTVPALARDIARLDVKVAGVINVQPVQLMTTAVEPWLSLDARWSVTPLMAVTPV